MVESRQGATLRWLTGGEFLESDAGSRNELSDCILARQAHED